MWKNEGPSLPKALRTPNRVVLPPQSCDLHLPESWNQGSPAEPHVGSIMLAPELLVPIAVFALLENGCKEVWKVENQGVHGIQPGDPPDTAESLKKWLGVENLRRLAYRGTAGDRNVHLMSGRVQ